MATILRFDRWILEEYVVDEQHTGWLKEITEETELALIASVFKNWNGWEKSAEVLAFEADISHKSILNILHKYDLTNTKPTYKSEFSQEVKNACLVFILHHEHWTLKN